MDSKQSSVSEKIRFKRPIAPFQIICDKPVMVFAHESHRLMVKRIHEVLLVSSPYDLYLLEEEGLLADRISDEYALFHLTNAPAITRVSTAKEALEAIRERKFDIVISGTRVGKQAGVFDMAKEIKAVSPDLPIALITSENWRLPALSKRRENERIDKIFYWHGDTKLFLAIIKIFEDHINAPHDCLAEQVRAIILVEDSPHFYSAYLPLIYTEIMEQTRALIAEGTSDEEKLLRMASRPKILHAETFEEAVNLYEKYKTNLLGIISDVRFPKAGQLDLDAGFSFAKLVKEDSPDIPVMLQSQDTAVAWRASAMGASFADKNSAHLLHDLRNFILTYFGFGDFVFRMQDGKEVGRAHSLKEMEGILQCIPEESIEYHSRHNHFSNWLFARGEFDLAAKLRPMRFQDFASVEDIRQTIRQGLKTARTAKQRSNISRFSQAEPDLTAPFIRFGDGSIGGKGRGIAFMSKLMADPAVSRLINGQRINIPQTAAIGTDCFEQFLEKNRLHKIAMTETDDSQISKAFLNGKFDSKLSNELATLLRRLNGPLAVRSSSLSEDSLTQPFAGLYTTYFLPNNNPDFEERLKQLILAVKLIYASTFYQNPKAYMEANGIALEGEKMAVLIQQVVGNRHGNYFYPDIAGVAQSYNFFPVGYLKPEDGVAEIVMGLGTMAVQGGRSMRFSPRYPGIMPQFARARDVVAHSQREFHALDLSTAKKTLTSDEGVTLATLGLAEAEEHGMLARLGGVYSPADDIIYDNMLREGKRVLTFKRVMEDGSLELPKIIAQTLELGSQGLGCAVEIEFAVSLAKESKPAVFSFLQIRPLVSSEEIDDVAVDSIDQARCIVRTDKAMGHGTFAGLKNLIYVRLESFNVLKTAEIANEIGRINAEFVSRGESYVLLGFGRWGTVNSQLGIPVTYAQVSHAKVIGEISTLELNVEPSQGTHFFHNIASSRIGYLSIDTVSGAGSIDWKWLASQKASFETNYIRHIKFETPIVTMINGHSGHGVIVKP